MDTPHSLSGSQRAYLFRRDQFLAGIDQRAAGLFTDGYGVAAGREPHVFLVLCPEKKSGERKGTVPSYRVDPAAQTCTCPFYSRQGNEPLTGDGGRVACKHLVGLPGLVHATCRDLVRTGNLGRYFRLWVQWHKACALRPDLAARWQALGPVRPDAVPLLGTTLHTDTTAREMTARKETPSCTGMTSPTG